MYHRVLAPEILDTLTPEDPRAIHSRRDLQRIDFFMGNTRWILRQIASNARPTDHIVELGAGDGHLGKQLWKKLPPGCRLTGIDLIPRPTDWPAEAQWQAGDLFAKGLPSDTSIVVASLILHHFTDAQLQQLGQWMGHARLLIAAEPHRRRIHLWQGQILRITGTNAVTNHDLAVSVKAGFRNTELAETLDLGPSWRFQQTTTCFGAYRAIAQTD